MASRPAEGAEQGAAVTERGEGGRFLPRHTIGVATRWRPGLSPNAGGRPRGPVAALESYLAGEAPLPKSYVGRLPAEVQEVLERDGLGPAVALGVVALALDPLTDQAVRLKALDWITTRYDGPVVQKREVRGDGMAPTQILIVQRGGGGDDGDEPPPFPEEVLEIERLEAATEEEAEQRRLDALGMGGHRNGHDEEARQAELRERRVGRKRPRPKDEIEAAEHDAEGLLAEAQRLDAEEEEEERRVREAREVEPSDEDEDYDLPLRPR